MSKAKEALGIDLGASAIKIVQARRTGGGVKITHAAVLPVSRPTDDAYSVGQPDLLLRGHLNSARLNTGTVVCSVDRSSAVVRSLSLPAASKADRDSMVRFEAESLVPFSLASAEMRHTGLPGEDSAGPNVVIAACPRDRLLGRIGFLRGAGIQPSEVAVSTLATYNCFVALEPDLARGAQLLLDIGAKSTEALVVVGGKLVTSLSFAQGGDQLTECLAKDLKVDAQEAETHKRTVQVCDAQSGMPPEDMAATGQWFSRLYDQVRRILDSQAQNAEQSPIGGICLCGQMALAPGLAMAMGAALSMAVLVLDPLRSLGAVGVNGSATGNGPALVTAVGLALQGVGEAVTPIDLTPAADAADSASARPTPWAAIAAAAVVVAMVAGGVLLGGRAARLQSALQRAQGELDRLPASQGEAATQDAGQLADLRVIVDDIRDPSADWLAVLTELSESLPVDLWLRSLGFEKGRDVTLRGRALSNAAVSDALDALERTKRYGRVRLIHSSAAKVGTKSVYEFEIRCEIPSVEKETPTKGSAGRKEARHE